MASPEGNTAQSALKSLTPQDEAMKALRSFCVQSMAFCFGCLSKGHYSKNCCKRITCQKCGQPHPTILHYDPENGKGSRDSEKTNSHSGQSSSNTSSVCHTVGERNSVTTSMIVPVWLHHKDNPEREVLVYALLDEASDSTFIKSETLVRACVVLAVNGTTSEAGRWNPSP